MARLLEEWLALTQAEAGAIQAAAWARVSEIQAGKSALQKSLVETHEKWSRENPQELNSPAGHPFRAELGRLISLESRNGELVAAQMRRARVQQETLNLVTKNLGKIRKSYVAPPSPTVLQCYS